MIRRDNKHKLITVFAQGDFGGQHNGRGRIAPHRFENGSTAGEIDTGNVQVDTVRVAFRSQQVDWNGRFRSRGHPLDGTQQHRALAG